MFHLYNTLLTFSLTRRRVPPLQHSTYFFSPQTTCQLKVELTYHHEPYSYNVKYKPSGNYIAAYNTFFIAGPEDNYRLNVSGYSGDARDMFLRYPGTMFSTRDKDNDMRSENCAIHRKGGWWYPMCFWGHDANPNGLWGTSHPLRGHMSWYSLTGMNAVQGTHLKIKQIRQ